ncbi:HAD family hydrolase [Picosynechococcus sp. PCC 11901]|uniref:HAD family hydrolase n=1 Tax=Picosynechococcus sp. PCC 11901 TaxID=2579791 RepID=UPI0010FBE651|nr:HAD family hydrolase [Picosynechococcus sp. PCC 11901]QCS50709.1 HAD family hydrolase [Picosynechococcus sp. PCC 11901]
MAAKTIIAFDFDGVICDGRPEYFHSASLGYQKIWPDEPITPTATLQGSFNDLRPLIETGWEMIILLRALQQGIPTVQLWQAWSAIVQRTLQQENLSAAQLMEALDQVRDRQLQTQLDQWLGRHHFYLGMVALLQNLLQQNDVTPYIITTKEARFTRQLLQHQNVDFPAAQIFGKEQKQPKTATLKQLLSPEVETFIFIEDRLKTLEKVQQQPELSTLQLFLADWGYNTAPERSSATQQGIPVVNLSQWVQAVTETIS